MIYFTTGVLDSIFKRKYLSNNGIALPDKDVKIEMNLFKSESLIIVKVVDICYFEKENELGIELMDCNSNGEPLPFILHKSKWNLVDQNYFTHESSESNNTLSEDKKLSVGSILILKEYTYENVDVIDKEANELDESEDYFLEDLIKIVDFFIIGFD